MEKKLNFIQDVHTYDDAIVDNTNPIKRIVILTDQAKHYKQVFFTNDPDSYLIEKCKAMRKLKIEQYKS